MPDGRDNMGLLDFAYEEDLLTHFSHCTTHRAESHLCTPPAQVMPDGRDNMGLVDFAYEEDLLTALDKLDRS